MKCSLNDLAKFLAISEVVEEKKKNNNNKDDILKGFPH